MTSNYRKPAVTTLALAISVALGLTAAPVHAYESPVHVFSVNDVLGDFSGATYGVNGTSVGASVDKSIICGLEDSAVNPCPEDAAQPFTDKSGVELFPIDSEFGAYVVDFVGAQQKARDDDYGEGWVGNLPDGSGLAVSNAVTDRYKVKAPLGTWCQGLGGNSVKCSTEHYTVMEHVLSCHEVIPYFFADPETGDTGHPGNPGRQPVCRLCHYRPRRRAADPGRRRADYPADRLDPRRPDGCRTTRPRCSTTYR